MAHAAAMFAVEGCWGVSAICAVERGIQRMKNSNFTTEESREVVFYEREFGRLAES